METLAGWRVHEPAMIVLPLVVQDARVGLPELVFCKLVSRNEGGRHDGTVVLHEGALVTQVCWLKGSASCSIGHNVVQGLVC